MTAADGERQQSAGGANAAPQHRKGHRRQESMYAMTGLYAESGNADCGGNDVVPGTSEHSHPPQHSHSHPHTVKCHSRNPSAGICDRDREREKEKEKPHQAFPELLDIPHDVRDCGILSWRPLILQEFSSIKVFVFFLSFLVTLQQALSSGYINSVITTIEKRFEIPSSLSGLIASSYEIGNVITVIFVSYLGSRRHIPVWIAVGAVIMGIGSLVFVLPHFIAENGGESGTNNKSDDNICRVLSVREQDVGLARLSQGLPPSNLRPDNCIKSTPSTFMPVMIFVVAQLLLGCGGSPLLTLGTTYVDDHVRPESASMYIGCMYSMAAFGPVVGFLLGAYLLSFHMDSFSGAIISIDAGDHRWVGMWWGGFLLGGLLLMLVAIPFFSFPKVLVREKEKIRLVEKAAAACGSGAVKTQTKPPAKDSGYGKDIKDIPVSMWRLLKNPVYVVTCLGACMELMIVSGFVVFLPKYLETQFSLGKSQASVFTGSIAIPGACIGIFMGGCLLKRLQLRPKGAVQFVLISNTICLSCYALLFFLGCDNVKMAGTTIPYSPNTSMLSEPFKVNLTAACNFNCLCTETDMEPVCGNNGLTYFSPCHAGCAAFSSRSNFTNCACVHENFSMWGRESATGSGVPSVNGASASALTAAGAGTRGEFAEVTVVPVATAGACNPPCTTIFPFLVLLFFMTFVVAVTQMPLLMIVLRSVSEEERSFALGMQFVIFRLFGYIPAPILFGNLIDSTCLLWKSSCGEKGGRCLLYDIEQFRYRYVGLCCGIKIVALGIFLGDWWLVRRRKHLETVPPLDPHKDIAGSIISLDKLFEELPSTDNASCIRSGVASGLSSTTNTPLDPTKTIVLSQSDSFRDPQKPRLQRNDSQYSQDSYQSRSGKNSRVLVASRHLRNDSKTIQLEQRSQQHSLDEPEKPELKHCRSDSRDSKHSRSNSKDYTFPRSTSKELHSHSRNSSKDFKLHSRSNSRDLSLEQLKHLALKSVENLDLTVLPLTKCVDEESKRLIESSGILRHRRTNSKDLKVPESKHKRTSSHHITMEPGPELQLQKGHSMDQLSSGPLDPKI